MSTLDAATDALRTGGIIAYPTEAVYGLGCDPADEAAVMRLLALKDRPVDKGLIVIAARVEQLAAFVDTDSLAQYPGLLESWPGPNTWLVPCFESTPAWLRGRYSTLAVRVTAHPVAAALCDAFEGPVVSTSANPGEQPPARDAAGVRDYFPGGVDVIVEGAVGVNDTVSSIRDARTGEQLR